MSSPKTSFDFHLNGRPKAEIHPCGHVSLLTTPKSPVVEYDTAVEYAINLCRLLGITELPSDG